MGYSSAQAKAFVDTIGPLIAKYAKQYGYQVASPIIGQAICESGITSILAVKYHNYFGLKAGSSKVGAWGIWDGTVVNMSTKEEYTPGILSNIKDYFRVFPDMETGVKGYFEFMNYNRYQNLKLCKTPSDYIRTAMKDGYCTSTRYHTTVMDLVNRYDLTKYDWNTTPEITKTNGKSIDAIAEEVINGKWGKGDQRKAMLTAAGYNYDQVQNRVNQILKN